MKIRRGAAPPRLRQTSITINIHIMKKYIVVKVCVILNQYEIVASYDSEEEAKEYTKMFNKYYETGETIYAYYELKGN